MIDFADDLTILREKGRSSELPFCCKRGHSAILHRFGFGAGCDTQWRRRRLLGYSALAAFSSNRALGIRSHTQKPSPLGSLSSWLSARLPSPDSPTSNRRVPGFRAAVQPDLLLCLGIRGFRHPPVNPAPGSSKGPSTASCQCQGPKRMSVRDTPARLKVPTQTVELRWSVRLDRRSRNRQSTVPLRAPTCASRLGCLRPRCPCRAPDSYPQYQ